MKIYVWGAGCGAGALADQGLDVPRVEAFLDSAPAGDRFLGRPVIRPEELRAAEDDLILVASRHTEEIARRACELGIRKEQLFFLKNNWTVTDRNGDYARLEAVLPPEAMAQLRRAPHVLREPLAPAGEALTERDRDNDYVRVRTLELLCAELESVPGAAAELGVYKGAFARCINALLPERTLYLFDTFSGFDAAEAAGQGGGFVDAHRNTSPEAVLRQLPHPEKAILRRGLFPETALGLEERFCLVSLDVDLEESTLAGLRWFLPRLNPGGYLLLHDCSSPALPGVREALRRYEAESGTRLRRVPLCDIHGTMVISV